PGTGIATFTINYNGEYYVPTSNTPGAPPGVNSSALTASGIVDPVSQLTTTGTGTGAQINRSSWYYNGGVWMSSDGGANFTWQGGADPRLNPSSLIGGGTGFNLMAVPGNEGHLICGGGSNITYALPLSWSIDGGVTWLGIKNTSNCYQAAAGATKPGNS